MVKRMCLVALGVVAVSGLTGCDEAAFSGVAADPSLKTAAAKLFGNDDVPGDQLWQRDQLRDQLRDGTGLNCSNPDGAGDCDGSGQYGGGGSGSGDQQRSRDGSCL